MPSTSTQIVIAVSPDALFDLIVDYDRYPEFVPGVLACRARRAAGVVDVDYEVDLGVKKVKYTLRHVEERPRRVAWSLVGGEWMKVSSGAWELAEEGAGTRARYTVEVEIAKPPFVPKALLDRVTEELTRVQLPRTLAAFKRRAEQA
jgi:coenzyme Q-binding protein COQ10